MVQLLFRVLIYRNDEQIELGYEKVEDGLWYFKPTGGKWRTGVFRAKGSERELLDPELSDV